MLRQRDHDLRKLRCIRDIGAIKVLPRLLDQQVAFLHIVRVTGIVAVVVKASERLIFPQLVEGEGVTAFDKARICRQGIGIFGNDKIVIRSGVWQQVTFRRSGFMQTVKRILRKAGHDGIAALRGDILLYISPLAIFIGFQLELCIRQQIALGTGVLHDRNIVGVEIDACVTGRIALEIYIFIDVRIIALQLHGILELIVLSGQILGIDRIVENQNQSLAVWYLRPDLNLVSILIPFGVVGILSNVFRSRAAVVISFNRVEILEESRCFQRAICLQLTLKDRDTCQCYTVGGGTIFAVQTIWNRHEIIQSQRHAIVQCDAVRIDLYLIGQKAGCFIIVAVFAHNISGDSFLKGITAALFAVPLERSVVDKGGNIATVPDLCVIRVQCGVVGDKNTFAERFVPIDCKRIALGLKSDHQFGAAVCLLFSRNGIVIA